MNIAPVNRPQTYERHVQFSEYVDVRVFEPTESTPVQPSLYAQRLERQLREQPCVEAQQQEQPKPSRIVNGYKNIMHTISVACGLLALPSLACVAIGPIGLIAPVALAALALVFGLLAGNPTETMLRFHEGCAATAREYDPR